MKQTKIDKIGIKTKMAPI